MATFACLFNDVGRFSMFKINLSYFPSRARLNFRWIFKEFDLKSNMKGFFREFSCFIGKETDDEDERFLLNTVVICVV